MFFSTKKERPSVYQDPTGEFTNRELFISSWYIRHKLLLQKIGTTLLILWCIGSVGYSLFAWGSYLLFGYAKDERLLAGLNRMPEYTAFLDRYRAEELQIRNVSVFESALERYDFVAQVDNPNSKWVAYLRYHFAYGNGRTPSEQTILLPLDNRPIIIFGHKESQRPGNAQFIVEGVVWERLDPHRFPDPVSYMKERLRFTVEDVNFEANGSDGLVADRLRFVLHNMSAYSYWEPAFYVELRSGGNIVGYAYVSLPQFRLGEARAIDVRLFGKPGNITDAAAYSVINVFDDGVYLTSAQR